MQENNKRKTAPVETKVKASLGYSIYFNALALSKVPHSPYIFILAILKKATRIITP
jgi:hypothetical protein